MVGSVPGAVFGFCRDAADVRALVQTLGLSTHVRFLGEQPPNEIAALMRRSALLVVPSRRETFSLVTAEALASGTPVVATRCGGPEEIITKDTGELSDVDDPAGLALAIETALKRSYDRSHLRRYAVDRFGSGAASNRLGRLYEQVTGSAQPHAASGALSDRPTIAREIPQGLVESAAARGDA